MMHIDVLTLFPGMFTGVLGDSILKRAQAKGLVKIRVHNLRDWTHDKRRTVDDKPFGGGPGMVLKPEPVYEACAALGASHRHVILLTPQGERLSQTVARELLAHRRVLLICGHYEGFDERIRALADQELSIGDYVLTGGEIPALVVIDSVVRLIPGVLGREFSLHTESFTAGMLEYAQYTRPRVYRGRKVPAVLLSGDHARIEQWRAEQSRQRTAARRPDLLGHDQPQQPQKEELSGQEKSRAQKGRRLRRR
jgi:tRNA (guanine37-N1)-methyltransferase